MKYLKNWKKAGGQGSDDKKMFVNRKAKSFKVELGKLSSMLQSRHFFYGITPEVGTTRSEEEGREKE